MDFIILVVVLIYFLFISLFVIIILSSACEHIQMEHALYKLLNYYYYLHGAKPCNAACSISTRNNRSFDSSVDE